MALALAALQPGMTIGTTTVAVYTTPSGKTAYVKKAVFVNKTGSTAQLSLSIARLGGNNTVIVSQVNLPAWQSYISQEIGGIVLNAGDIVYANSTVDASINAFLSGLIG